MKRDPVRLDRRALITTGGTLALAAVVPLSGCAGGRPDADAGGGPTAAPRFLSADELATLEALVDRLIPGQPEDLDPGALAAGCADAIDHLLGAFLSDPPFIYAGAPFSDRGGAEVNDFARFLPLDPYEELAWRLTIEGSQGRAEREFNGPVTGLQTLYLDGLARLEERARAQGFDSFGAMPGPARDLLLNDGGDAVVQAMLDRAFPDTLDAMYGAPEYGGNRELLGWGFTAYDGDVQPRGWTDEQVINADNPGPFDALLPPSYGGGGPGQTHAGAAAEPAAGPAVPLAAVASSEIMAAAIMDAGGSLRRLRARLGPLARGRRA